jgi:hypothetical protein
MPALFAVAEICIVYALKKGSARGFVRSPSKKGIEPGMPGLFIELAEREGGRCASP